MWLRLYFFWFYWILPCKKQNRLLTFALKNLKQNFIALFRKQPWWSPYLRKVASLKLVTFPQKILQHRYFLRKFDKIFQKWFLHELWTPTFGTQEGDMIALITNQFTLREILLLKSWTLPTYHFTGKLTD